MIGYLLLVLALCCREEAIHDSLVLLLKDVIGLVVALAAVLSFLNLDIGFRAAWT